MMKNKLRLIFYFCIIISITISTAVNLDMLKDITYAWHVAAAFYGGAIVALFAKIQVKTTDDDV